MLMTEYDYDTDIAVQREEAYEDGLSKGAYEKAVETAKNLFHLGLTIEQISTVTGLSLETIKQLEKDL